MNLQSLWASLRITLVPGLLIIGSPIVTHILATFGHMERINMTWSEIIFGNMTSWKIAIAVLFWAFLFLKLPAKQYYGPTTSSGFTPKYQDNGFFYYLATVLLFMATYYIYPSLPHIIYSNIPHLLSTLNMIALIFCAILWLKGKYYPYEKKNMGEVGFLFEFYSGIEHHPRIFDVDIKQLTINRLGLMVWQLLILTYLAVSYDKFGFNWGMTVHSLLQTIYFTKIFYFEYLCFHTLDLILDNLGFYLCWGSLVFIPGFFTFNTYYFVANPPVNSQNTAMTVLILGLICLLLTFLIDYEKDVFKKSNGKRSLWSNKPKFIMAEYKIKNKKVQTKLLASGFWGVSRHLNYVFESASYFVWSFPGHNSGIWPFICPIFVFFFIFHRSLRDDDKCSKKYGVAWQEYRNLVKYKIIPYVY